MSSAYPGIPHTAVNYTIEYLLEFTTKLPITVIFGGPALIAAFFIQPDVVGYVAIALMGAATTVAADSIKRSEEEKSFDTEDMTSAQVRQFYRLMYVAGSGEITSASLLTGFLSYGISTELGMPGVAVFVAATFAVVQLDMAYYSGRILRYARYLSISYWTRNTIFRIHMALVELRREIYNDDDGNDGHTESEPDEFDKFVGETERAAKPGGPML